VIYTRRSDRDAVDARKSPETEAEVLTTVKLVTPLTDSGRVFDQTIFDINQTGIATNFVMALRPL